MKRKVVKHGPSSLIVSLPSSWVKKLGIRKGEDISMVNFGDKLILSKLGAEVRNAVSINAIGLEPRLVDRFLARSYQKGFDSISILFDDYSIMDTIRTKVSELIGFEIMEESSKSTRIQSISKTIDLDFNTCLRKIFHIAKDMAETCNAAYKAGNKKDLESLYPKDFELNRLCYFCLRQISKSQNYSAAETDIIALSQTNVLYYMIETIEDLGDEYKALGKLLSAEMKTNPRITEILRLLCAILENSFNYYYRPTKDAANLGYNYYKEVRDMIDAQISPKLSPNEIRCYMLLNKITLNMYHYITMRLDFLSSPEEATP